MKGRILIMDCLYTYIYIAKKCEYCVNINKNVRQTQTMLICVLHFNSDCTYSSSITTKQKTSDTTSAYYDVYRFHYLIIENICLFFVEMMNNKITYSRCFSFFRN